MVDVEAGEFTNTRRLDADTSAAVVLAADAVVFVLIAVVGVPFLAFFFGDEDGGWQRLWPLFTGWFVAALLAGVSTAAAVRFAGMGSYDARRIGVGATIGTTVAAGVFAATSMPESPMLALAATTFAGANLAAAVALLNPERAAAVADRFAIRRPGLTHVPAGEPAYDERETESDRAAVTEATTAGLPVEAPATDLAADADRATATVLNATVLNATVLKRRPRGQAALRTMSGVRLPRRARGTRSPSRAGRLH